MSQSGQEGVNESQTDGAQSGQQGSGGAGTGSQDTTNGSGAGADGAQHDSGANSGQETVSRADFDRIQAQLRAADQKREAAEREAKALKDKDLSELEKAKSDLEEATKTNASLEEEVNQLRLHNAFLSANTITWQNSDVALKIAQAEGYLADVVDDKGVVDGKKMAAALKRLSDEHKYLVKAANDDQQQGAGSSGEPAGGRSGNNADDKARKDRLMKQFPALGRR